MECVPESLFKLCCKDSNIANCIDDNRKIILSTQCFKDIFWSSEISKIHLTSRIIYLNKVSQSITKNCQVWYIVAISPILKLLEFIILQYLMKYAFKNLSDTQRGFITGRSTHQNITDILSLANRGKQILFVDFAPAFDNIDRRKLYKIIANRNIILNTLLNLILFIYTNRSVKLGKHKISTCRGVPKAV